MLQHLSTPVGWLDGPQSSPIRGLCVFNLADGRVDACTGLSNRTLFASVKLPIACTARIRYLYREANLTISGSSYPHHAQVR